MYLGKVVEVGSTDDIFTRPRHPYTEALISAIALPDPTLRDSRQRIILPGEIPSPRNPPPGCPFHPRCRYAEERCTHEVPPPIARGGDHLTACHFPERIGKARPVARQCYVCPVIAKERHGPRFVADSFELAPKQSPTQMHEIDSLASL